MTEPVPSRRRWLWVAAVVVLLGISILPATYLYVRWSGDRELAAVRAELDAADPDWRMPDLFAARNAALAGLKVNSADTVAEAVKLLPDGWDRASADVQWPGDGPLNRQPEASEADRLREVRGRIAPALAVARRLRDQPDGGSVLTVPDFGAYMLDLNLMPVMERRQVAHALSTDAALAALDGDPDTAVRSAHAGLNVARSVGGEPLLISQLVRLACAAIAARSAERVLALSEPDRGLAELQAAFHREAGERFMRDGLRGELASIDQIMDNVRAGRVGGTAAGLPTGATLNPFYPHDHAAGLRLLRAAVEDADQPPHLHAAADRAEQGLKAEPQYRVISSRMLAPVVGKCLSADARSQATLQTAAVGLACERHRRATGRWPDTLAELPRELLPTVPADPFDGRPLRYKRTADGAVVYSVGENRTDDGGETSRGSDGAPKDVGFRLFDPARRRLPPLPPAPADKP